VRIRLPYKYSPRAYQLPFWQAMEAGKKRAVLVNHRRAGKDKTAFNFMVREAMKRVGIYYYFLPTYNQGRKVIWDGIDKDGFKFLDHAPKELRKGDPNQTEMKLTLINGSLIQVVGTDNIDSVVGTNPVGTVFSEYPLQDPSGWEFVRPILRENGGWAVFAYTPRGKNHGWDLFEMAQANPEWHCERLTIDDTFGKGGTVGPHDVDEERKSGMSENMIQQEYYCSFDAAVENAVFGEQMFLARKEGRITRVPWEPLLPVSTYWDIGRDGTAIWFVQAVRNEVRVIDYFDSYQSDLPSDLAKLRAKGYNYDTLWLPHDGDYKDYKTGKTPKEIASSLGFSVDIVDRIDKGSQIRAARALFNRCWFDAEKCRRGIDALASWHFGWDEKLRILSTNPVHDWASHGGDAFCQIALKHEDQAEWRKPDAYSKRKKPNRSWLTA
jgi:phage terminase large subunit